MTDVEPEIVERMVGFVRSCAEKPALTLYDSLVIINEARAIVALLPEPVDPDLVEARLLSISFRSGEKIKDEIMSGKRDDEEAIQALLAAIKRGRQLATGATND